MTSFAGTKQENDALQGRGVLQSPEEWEARNASLAGSLVGLIDRNVRLRTGRALDIGCQQCELTDRYAVSTPFEWHGLEPDAKDVTRSRGGVEIVPGVCDDLPFQSMQFDCVTLANVFEHLDPAKHARSMLEIYRVLTPGGVLVGQLPNPYFPIESHSRLPFFGFVPRKLQPLYWKLSPTGWDYESAHFFIVTIRDARRAARQVGFQEVLTQSYNYPLEAIPHSFRLAARLHAKLGVMPWAWQFVFRRPEHT
ncbi:methyltransferase domain-containing protein [Methylobacterium sp. NI91]|nr:MULTISPECIES: class I SAM-dependent methyltransferase [unclassified Methylobacterium]QIJ73318.1 methyltransferase domain-containing protein [Methylobacterium sp. CLZ]QIJ78222.1 methyltransferase domain-containing protein [Methylobacterium sp. NI91]